MVAYTKTQTNESGKLALSFFTASSTHFCPVVHFSPNKPSYSNIFQAPTTAVSPCNVDKSSRRTFSFYLFTFLGGDQEPEDKEQEKQRAKKKVEYNN